MKIPEGGDGKSVIRYLERDRTGAHVPSKVFLTSRWDLSALYGVFLQLFQTVLEVSRLGGADGRRNINDF